MRFATTFSVGYDVTRLSLRLYSLMQARHTQGSLLHLATSPAPRLPIPHLLLLLYTCHAYTMATPCLHHAYTMLTPCCIGHAIFQIRLPEEHDLQGRYGGRMQ